MKISYIMIKNYKSIQQLEIREIENAMILVGKNNTGKTSVIDALLLASGSKKADDWEYLDKNRSIEIALQIEYTDNDLYYYYTKGIVSKSRDYETWFAEFQEKLPSYRDGVISFTCIITPQKAVRYADSFQKNNPFIPKIFPKIYHIDQNRNLEALQNDVFSFYDKESFQKLKDNQCTFDSTRTCNRCFQCIGVINKKTPEELTLFETARLLQYKLFRTNLNEFAKKVNEYFHSNGSPSQEIQYVMNYDIDSLLHIDTMVYNKDRGGCAGSINYLSEGLRSIYALSLLEAYIDEDNTLPCIIMIEDPEIYLHPQLQKVASEILFRLSKKNQVVFSTHSPNMIFNFSTKQIKEVVLDENYFTIIKEDINVDVILDDLGYTANDLMNVSFVFIVEGKQDKNRLPMLLEKYYSEIFDENGNLQRITIVPTNSCTNIKTYANLKYINQLYLKDQFLMIRDSDGKNPKYLKKQLCSYYSQRAKEDVGNLPKVKPENVLILKYYSFENYFLDPKVMTKIGVIKSEEDFYNILYKKYKDYLFKLSSVKRMLRAKNFRIQSKQDIKDHIEDIKIYVRGHNLFDIFYGRYHGTAEQEILKKYIDAAPRETFQDIFDAIDSFVYFENRKK
ncbi:MAG: ATP-binding protein [Clostridiaceae bacterium]|nr:ATP-binding protein [Clostridiaceae bacterium]